MSEPVASPPPEPPEPRDPPSPGPSSPQSSLPEPPPPPRPSADEPEPVYPAEVHAPHAHRPPVTRGGAREGRPLIERLGLAAVALVIALFFGAVGAISFGGGELFLGTMAVLGALMTAWVGLITLLRG